MEYVVHCYYQILLALSIMLFIFLKILCMYAIVLKSANEICVFKEASHNRLKIRRLCAMKRQTVMMKLR